MHANVWTKRGYVTSGTPTIWKNMGNARQYGVAPGQVSLHPGPKPYGDVAVLRFTAPQAGQYLPRGRFLAGDSGSMSGRVIVNGNASNSWMYVATTTDTSVFPATPIELKKDGTIDFVIGNNGNYGSGTPRFDVVVEFQAALPGQTIEAYLDDLPQLVVVPAQSGIVSAVANTEDGVQATQRTGGRFVNRAAELALLRNFADIVWSGALVQGNSLGNSNFAPIQLARAPGRIRISTNLIGNSNAVKYRDLPSIDAGSVERARDEMLRALDPKGSVAPILKQEAYASTLREAMVKLGIAYSGGSASASLDSQLNMSSEEKSYFLLFNQEFYTLAFDPRTSSGSPYFAPAVKLADVKRWASPANPPVYVNEVKFGRLLMVTFTSSLSKIDLQAVAKATYSGASGSLEGKLREDAQRVRVSVLSLGAPGDVALKPLLASTAEEMMAAVREYMSAGINFSVANPGAPIAFSMRYVGSRNAGAGPSTPVIAQMVTDEGPEIVSCTVTPVSKGSRYVWDGPGGGWLDTGIDVEPGASVSIKASGTNTSGVFGDWSGYGPRGWHTWDKPNLAEGGWPITDRSPFCLIGRLGYANEFGLDRTKPDFKADSVTASSSFFVGDSKEFRAGSQQVPKAGRLFLGTNDNNPLNGNANFKFKVDIWVTPAAF